MNIDELVLGVDGGGTKTVAWLGKIDGATSVPVGQGVAGPTNPSVVGRSRAIAALDQAIDAALSDAGVAPGVFPAACLAVSGTERSAHRAAILKWAADRSLATEVQLVNDAEAVLAGGTRGGWGVALIAGTGSFAFGRDLQGLTVRVGGWGYLFGDEGSGHALSAAALRAATQYADRRGPATTLLSSLMTEFDLTDPLDLLSVFYSGQRDTHASMAELAPLVTAAAEAGDDVARQLVNAAAADLACLVIAACDQMSLPPRTFPLAIAGGVVCGSPLMRTCLQAALAAKDHLTCEITLVEQPVRGAVDIARRAASQR